MSNNKQRRLFLGKTEGFKDKQERSYYQKMLKAYLKGHEYFRYGTKVTNIGQVVPNMVSVQQKYLSI